ncbi:MAG TPA: hypothetical protein VKT19_03440 [Steroidobacteraceae bacterium]|nr:hypothetical protein [Steroidobacteraceae bacterium]
MSNRRELLQASLGLVVSAPAWSIPSARFTASRNALVRPPIAIYDLRYVDSVAFGERARRLGIVACPVKETVTAIWLNTLAPAWHRNPDAGLVMGLSGFDVLFCLEMMAHHHGHRVVYRAHHRPDPTETTIHEEILSESASAALPSTAWGGELAMRLARHLNRPLRRSDAERCRAAGAMASLGHDDLVSWVIAPNAMLV